MKKLFILIAILLLFFNWQNLYAGRGEGAGGFLLGGNFFDFDNLSRDFRLNGYPRVDNTNFFLGGMGYAVINNKVIIGGEGGGFWQSVGNSFAKVNLSGGYGFFDLGYVIHSERNFRIFPVLGIGGGGISLKIFPAQRTPTFEDILNDPYRKAEFTTSNFAMHFSLGMDIKVASKEKRFRSKGLLLGARFGYVWIPGDSDWQMDGMEVFAGPKTNFEGFYIHFLIGGFGERR
jgi:hypothetical protein